MASQGARFLSRTAVKRSPNPFIFASLVSGFAWYFTSQRCKDITNQKKELIRRVQSGETAENFKETFNYQNAEDFECKKVQLEGTLGMGRFFIKRNRGKQEGYYVLAPFTVQSFNTQLLCENVQKFNIHTFNRKFILNLGWFPRSRKDMAFETFSNDIMDEQIYTERQEATKQQQKDGIIRDPLLPSLTTRIIKISAYVRRGQVQDKLNGRVNYKQNFLYKWIDLNLLTRAFRVFNEEEGETVYLQRALQSPDEPESFPLVATKQTVIEELNNQIKYTQKNANFTAKGISGVAFGLAAWMTFL